MTSPSSRAPATANAASAAGAILSVGNTIGRYFSLTSMVPSVLFVLWTYVLLASGAGSGPPDLNRLAPAFTISAEKVSGLVLATLFVGLFLHPLQFGMTRLLEGYWGVSSVALSLSAARINHHRAKARDLMTARGCTRRACSS